MHNRYKDRVQFLAVYVREAHPTDGWRMPSNDNAGISIKQPANKEERLEVAKQCCAALEITMPLLVDTMDDRVGHRYSGMPDRLYVIDRQGRIAYKGGRGPFGFKSGEMEQQMIMLLLDEAEPKAAARFPVPTSAEAWKHLPPATKGAGQPLPAWARVLAPTLPRTTAAMLELEYRLRTQSLLDQRLRAKMRLLAARANGCAYTAAQAAADLERFGITFSATTWQFSDELALHDPPALQFAQKLTQAAHTVTDDEVAQLILHFGEKDVVAMVQLLAFASFQDRLILSLGIQPGPAEPTAPLDAVFAKEGSAQRVQRSAPAIRDAGGGDAPKQEWSALDFNALQKLVADQKSRYSRIYIPSWDDVRKLYPADKMPAKPLRIQWSLVCLGYQPELAQGWSACTRAFAQEAGLNRVFEESLFWVVTRTLQCFY